MSTYEPHNILLTGGAGFIGSHVLINLVTNYPQYRVVNLDKLDYCSSLKNIRCIENKPNYTFVQGDILSTDLIKHLLKTHNIDTIMHFAAQSHVDNSFGNSLEFTKNNIMGTHVLLECARIHGIKRFIHVSTDEVYGESSKTHAMEGTVLEPTNPYAASKAGAEYVVKSYIKSFKVPCIITRSNNVYGPHQYPEKIIPKFIGLLERGRPCCLHGDGSHKRSFLYVTDVVRAFDIILHKGSVGEIYNIGSQFEISNLELTKRLLKKYNLNEDKYIQYVEDRAFNDVRYLIDDTKLQQFGWKPETSFEDGLDLTIDWFRKNFDNWDNSELALTPHPKFVLSPEARPSA